MSAPQTLRLGSIAPNFVADTTNGKMNFHDYIKGSWAILFSHPGDFTPVCTTELGAFSNIQDEFTKRGVKLIGLSADPVESHKEWVKDVDELSGSHLSFPIVGDEDRKVSVLYDMIDHLEKGNVDKNGDPLTIRSVFIIDPNQVIRTILSYPASTGRNVAEIIRIIDSLQLGDKHRVVTPIDWQPGQDVIVKISVPTDEAKKVFPDLKVVKPYLRFTPMPKQ